MDKKEILTLYSTFQYVAGYYGVGCGGGQYFSKPVDCSPLIEPPALPRLLNKPSY
jgi:hypothetical protein